MEVKQGSERLGIEWREFSIGEGERVHFAQPSRSAIALNRVTGPKGSQIRGRLTANGNVFLVNRNGVIFHGGSSVDVGGLLATTSQISNEDFMAGRYRFHASSGEAGRIVNEGRISAAEGGLVALVGPRVENGGLIEARLGRVVLGSGEAFTLDLYGDELVSFAVGEEAAGGLVEHSGEIEADGGRVWLTAGKAKGVVDGVINLSGVVRARTVSRRGGRIVLAGGESGRVEVSGQVDASGGVGDKGGRIEVTGERIQVAAGAKVDASGGSGGGTVLVGGDYQGGGSLGHAEATRIEGGSVIRADATGEGDGGTVVVWSDERTEVDGSLSARGGPGGGDGGLVETSSAGELEFTVPADVSAAKGEGGTWLLDPQDIEIDRGKADSIEAALNGGGNVSIRTSDEGEGEGNISVNASITKTEGGDASLSLRAHNRIDVNQPIRSQAGKLGVSLEAGKEVNVKAGIETNGGGFTSRITGVTTPEPVAEEGASDSETQSGEVADTSPDQSAELQTSDETQVVAGSDGDAEGETSGETTAPSSDGETQLAQDSDAAGDTTTSGGDEELASEENSEPAVTGLESTVPEAQAQPQSTDDTDLQWVTVSDRVATRGGGISVDAGDSGVSLVTGTLDSSNLDEGQRGGDIEVLGQHVVLAGQAELDASGDAGGGDINIGGDYQGKGERRQAQTTTIGKDVTIRSDAVTEGDAGDVVVWSRGTTRYSGAISARGGAEGGDGGQVEVSGKQNLGFWGTVDAGAPAGTPGSLLLDPGFMNVIDAKRGDGQLDPDILCDDRNDQCTLPASLIAELTPDDFAALGIDPDPETPLNTVTWGRLIQLADATGFAIYLNADQDITFRALNGTMSTPGSPTGDPGGLTVTLALSNPATLRNNNRALVVTSDHGDIVFENPEDNLAVLGGAVEFMAPEGSLHLGNLYGLGPTEEIPPTDEPSWRSTSINLTAKGDIDVGTINTRNEPARFADPSDGSLQPQDLLIGNSGFIQYGDLDVETLFSDRSLGGDVYIASDEGDINVLGPVYTGSSYFTAITGGDGTFTATDIDTGANRLWVRHFAPDAPRLNTLNTGDVAITADKISFNTIHAGQVELHALTYASDAITGEVTIDNFWETDVLGSTRTLPDGGIQLTVGNDPNSTCFGNCIADGIGLGSDPLTIDWVQVGTAFALGDATGDKLMDANDDVPLGGFVARNLTADFSFLGGATESDARAVAPTLPVYPMAVLTPEGGPVPIVVPLNLPSAPPPSLSGVGEAGPTPIQVTLGGNAGGFSGAGFGSVSPAVGPGGADTAPITVGLSVFSPTRRSGGEQDGGGNEDGAGEQTADSSDQGADEESDKDAEDKNKDEDDSNEVTKKERECTQAEQLTWLERGPHSPAQAMDWGRRLGVGTDPADTSDVFRTDKCSFTKEAKASDVDTAG